MSLLETIEVETGPRPSAAVIMLHGLGADGNDFVPLAHELQLASAGSVRFIFPHAPVIPVTINNGMRMRAWYDILGLELARREDEAGLRKSLVAVEELLAQQKQRGIAPRRTVLAGFSQGCAMALLAGVRHREQLAGIAGLSGYLPLAAMTAAERAEENVSTPVFMAHGRQDNVVALDRGTASRDALQALGYAVEWHAYAMAHSVCPEEVGDLNKWLLEVLSEA